MIEELWAPMRNQDQIQCGGGAGLPAMVFLSDDGGRTLMWDGAEHCRIYADKFDVDIQEATAREAEFTTVVVPVRCAFAATAMFAACRGAMSLLAGMADESERDGKRNAAINVREVERSLAEAIGMAGGDATVSSVPRAIKPTDIAVLDYMVRTGGGFVSKLAAAWMNADHDNQRRLMLAFGHYYDQYEADVAHADRRKAVAS